MYPSLLGLPGTGARQTPALLLLWPVQQSGAGARSLCRGLSTSGKHYRAIIERDNGPQSGQRLAKIRFREQDAVLRRPLLGIPVRGS